MDEITRDIYSRLNAHDILLRNLYQDFLFSRPVDLRRIALDTWRKVKDDSRHLSVDPEARAEALEIRPKVQEYLENFFRSFAVDTRFP